MSDDARVIVSSRTLEELQRLQGAEPEICIWPKPQPNARMVPHARKGNSDTTKKNMGRRKNPKCSTWTCARRVDAPGDLYCRVCVDRCWT